MTSAARLQKTASIAGLSVLRVAKGEKPDAYLLKQTFEKLGVTYIKLGQFIASTPSIFPREYVLAFQECLDATTPVGFDVVESVLRAELGDIEQIFASIDKKPLASASIAQVHKAVLKTGEKVAIKVQKPDVGTVIATDLGVLHGAFWLTERLIPSMRLANLAPIIDEIRTRMMAETDFVAESRHLGRFHQFLQSVGNTAVVVPKVYQELTTRRVLTMELFEGISLVDERLQGRADPKQVMATVLDTWFLSLMMTGEFHADLHAGNVMLCDDGRVGFLDFGLMGKIEPKSLQACFLLVQAMQASDFHAMAQAMIDIGMTHENKRVSVAVLATDLQKILGKVNNPASHAQPHAPADTLSTKPVQDPAREQAESLNVLMLEISEVGKRHGIHFPRDFALLTKQLLYFDRFMVTLAPDMELLEGDRLKIVKPM
ncbi:MAG: AarF/ABC1/UbiB kinase family protein [Moraxella sp.]|nr:AarF/ABC1/UbiB kinase family protein [Moraxella sp.]